MASSTIGQSSRYDSFCAVVNQLASTEVYDPDVVMVRLATNAMVDFDALMRNLKSMREQQIHYADYVLDNGAEFKDLPELILMRSLMSLSFDGKWNIPQDNPTYHDMWELVDTIDATLTSPEYSPREDIVAHLAKKLPGSMHEALEFFQYFGDKLQPIQQQHIFGMSLASLEWPQGVEKLLDAVYFNNMHDTASAIALFEAINPATKVMNMYMTLYDGYDDLVKNIPSLTALREVFMGEDALRDKGNADELVKKMGYQAGEFQEHEW